MRRILIPLSVTLCCAWLGAGAVLAQNAPPPVPVVRSAPAAAQDNEEVPVLQYPNNPVSDILALYEKLTGKVLIRDASLATAGNISLISTKPISKEEAIHFIEASLLLNGVSLVPDSGNQVKAIFMASTAKNPRSEAVPLYDNPSSIPPGNEVVSYFMPLRFMSSTDALAVFTKHVVLHNYGQIIEVPNAQALVITENAPLIRELIDLQELIDVPSVPEVSEFVTLKRADAERVAETINKLIEAEKAEKEKRTAANAAGNNGAPPAGANANGTYEDQLVAGPVQLVPDARTNRILVITRRASFAYIKNLIAEFDEEVGMSAPLERPLKYISASEVLPVLADALQEQGGANGQGGAAGQPPPNQNRNIQPTNQAAAAANANGSGEESGVAEPADILPEPQDEGPTSQIVGKTHLIADNKANAIIVIGPPESQEKVRVLLDKLDQRPPQVYLSTVIGQLQLINDSQLGVDYLKLFQSASALGNNQNGYAGSVLNTATSLVTPQSLTSAAAFPATGGLSLYGTIGKNISVYLNALESTNRFKVLARPAVYTANNKKAVILSGQKVPYPTSTVSTVVSTGTNGIAQNSSIAYEDVVLKLEVIPLINANNEVNLKIAQVDDTLSGTANISGNNVPTINTQKIVTTVTVPDGDTVVLGGLITENTTYSVSGIPILMHLPWVGPAFRNTIKNKERDELIIFIQPTVVNSDADILAASNGEKNRADTGNAAYQFSQPAIAPPPLPQKEQDSIFPKVPGQCN